MQEDIVHDFLRKKGDHLFHRESQELEFKEQFNFAGLAEYFRDFAAFANNRGGYLIFGVENSPRIPSGLSTSSLEQFNQIDPETISGYIIETFSSDISWEMDVVELYGKDFGVFHVLEAITKPVIAKKDAGRNQEIKNGEIYYRYGGRTQKIQYAELENIISGRVEKLNKEWLTLMSKIARIGPQNAAILDTESGIIEKSPDQIMVIDEALVSKLKFIKEGEFSEKQGTTTLKLIGDVVPVDKVEIIRKVREHLTKVYPYSAAELAAEVKKLSPSVGQNQIWGAIKDNRLKENKDYSAYNFRNRKQEAEYESSGVVASGTPNIYNKGAIEFIANILKENE